MKCERCGTTAGTNEQGMPLLFDYCAHCSKNLCERCMAKGCCGCVPAVSGSDADDANED